MSDHVIDIEHLSRSFGKTQALQDVSLRVPRGGVYGLIGSNGAGKTTLIKHILGSHDTISGTVRIFWLDPVAEPAGVIARIRSMSEARNIPAGTLVQEPFALKRSLHTTGDSGDGYTLLGLCRVDSYQ